MIPLDQPSIFLQDSIFEQCVWPLHHIRVDGRIRTRECRFELNQVFCCDCLYVVRPQGFEP